MKNVNETNGKVIVNNNLKRGNKTMKKSNGNLHKAKAVKNDEFYTTLELIEKELYHYRDQLRGKVIYLNCDDHEKSNFWLYFRLKFNELGLKKVIATHYSLFGEAYKLELLATYRSGEPKTLIKTPIEGNGDFRSPASIELLRQADIVITNPPFSLFREYVAQLVEHDKKFLIIGGQQAIGYRDIFKLFGTGELRLGHNSCKSVEFKQPFHALKWESMRDGVKYKKVAIAWFTNLDVDRGNDVILFGGDYLRDTKNYPKYDNYDAIDVGAMKDIPGDYYGVMGVPLTFMAKHNPDQFDIVGFRKGNDGKDLRVNGKEKFTRILVQRKAPKFDYASGEIVEVGTLEPGTVSEVWGLDEADSAAGADGEALGKIIRQDGMTLIMRLDGVGGYQTIYPDFECKVMQEVK
jgi:hypothetical protein